MIERAAEALAGVAFADDERIGVVSLDAGPGNVLTAELLEAVAVALDAVEDHAARVVVIRSAVDGVFASMGDVAHASRTDATGFVVSMQAIREVLDRLDGLGIPSVAAIDGAALGGGLELALACTMRVAGAAATLGLPQVKLGVIPVAGGTQRLPRLIGHARALDLLVTGRSVDGAEAYGIGLVDRLAPAGEASEAALALAGAIAAASRPAVGAVRRAADAADLRRRRRASPRPGRRGRAARAGHHAHRRRRGRVGLRAPARRRRRAQRPAGRRRRAAQGGRARRRDDPRDARDRAARRRRRGRRAPARDAHRDGADRVSVTCDTAPQVRLDAITRTDIVRFAGAGGDFNPLHHDEHHARAAGFPTVFAMGQMQAGMLSRLASDRYGLARLRSYRVRFTAKVWPGDELTLRVAEEQGGHDDASGREVVDAVLEAVRQDGEVAVRAWVSAWRSDGARAGGAR